jgi:predicted O-methyltransferase YrrM
MTTTAELATRYDLIRMCGEMGLRSFVEIGVMRGKFSHSILWMVPESKVFSVDPWLDIDGNPMSDIMTQAINRLRPFSDRNTIIHGASLDVVKTFDDHSVDVVYIDGDHRYEAVKQDMAAWYPKVRSGGILAGDDYGLARHNGPALEKLQSGRKNWYNYKCGVMPAVHEFAAEMQLELHVTTIETIKYCPNWWFFVP